MENPRAARTAPHGCPPARPAPSPAFPPRRTPSRTLPRADSHHRIRSYRQPLGGSGISATERRRLLFFYPRAGRGAAPFFFHRSSPRPSVSNVPSRPSSHVTPTSLAPAVTTATTLDKGLGILESAASDASAAFDVALVEGKQAEPLFHAPSSPATATAGAATTAATAPAPDAALSARFTRLAKDVAIVLMHEEEDVSSKAYMIEAIKVGVVDVVRFPLVKQSMRTLWQHAVRKMIRAQAEASAKRSGAVAKRGSSRNGGLRLDQDNSGDSSASEERALKRQTAGSPASVLDEEEKAGVAESGGATKRVAAGAKGVAGAKGSGKEPGAAEGSGKKSGGASKPKPQARSTQQWKAAEQRGRRLAIKPHTAMTQGAQGGGPGPQMGRMGYYHPQQGQMMGMGQTQTMTINGQQVQVWVPMQHGMYAHPQQQQQNNPGQGGAPQNTAQPNANGAAQPPTNGPNGASPSGGKTGTAGGGGAGAQQQQPQPQHGYYGGGGMMQMQGGYHQPPPGMMLVQHPNGQQMWVQQAPVHGGWGQQQWGEASGGDGGDAAGGGGYAGASPAASTGVPGFDAVDAIKGQPLPLGLNLKRSSSLQNMVETSGLLDAKFDNPMDANMFRDVEFMEEDALDAILAQSRDGNLLSFDGMDEAMLEAAAGGGNGLEGLVRG